MYDIKKKPIYLIYKYEYNLKWFKFKLKKIIFNFVIK